jgi:N-methylhydantoinase B
MRGGLGRKMIIRVPDDEFAPSGPTSIALQAGRFKYAPGGLFGAESGAIAQFLVNDEAGDPSGLTLCQPGDVIQFHSAGGGGYGVAFERDPGAVEQDVRNGYVSIEKAREEYGVVVEPDNLEVNLAETEKIRAAKAK